MPDHDAYSSRFMVKERTRLYEICLTFVENAQAYIANDLSEASYLMGARNTLFWHRRLQQFAQARSLIKVVEPEYNKRKSRYVASHGIGEYSLAVVRGQHAK